MYLCFNGLNYPLFRLSDLRDCRGPFGAALFVDEIPFLSKFLISDISTVSLIGEIGIIFLMFMIGLELLFRRLMEMRHLVLGLGSLQIVINAIAIALVVLLFNNSPLVSILVGISFSLSSTAIVMQLLGEQHQNNRPVGKISFAILLMQDLAVVPLLVIIGAMSLADSGTSLPFVLAKSMLIAVAVVGVIYIAGTKLLRPLLGLQYQQKPRMASVSGCFLGDWDCDNYAQCGAIRRSRCVPCGVIDCRNRLPSRD